MTESEIDSLRYWSVSESCQISCQSCNVPLKLFERFWLLPSFFYSRWNTSALLKLRIANGSFYWNDQSSKLNEWLKVLTWMIVRAVLVSARVYLGINEVVNHLNWGELLFKIHHQTVRFMPILILICPIFLSSETCSTEMWFPSLDIRYVTFSYNLFRAKLFVTLKEEVLYQRQNTCNWNCYWYVWFRFSYTQYSSSKS